MLFLTETWLSENVPSSLFCPENFQVIRCDRLSSKGGGVLLLYKKSLIIKEVHYDGETSNNYESLCVDLFINNRTVRFCFFYVPPDSSHNSKIMTNICTTLKNCYTPSEPFYLFGDFNLPKINWDIPVSLIPGKSELHISQTNFLDFCIENTLQQCIDVPTHEKGNILDLLLCNPLAHNSLISTSVLPPLSSSCDHSMISFSLKFAFKEPLEKSFIYPDFHNANYALINQELEKVNWDSLFNSGLDFQSMYNEFILSLHAIIARFVPLKSSKSKRHGRPKHISKLLKQKLSLYKKVKTNPSLKNEYKALSKNYEKVVNDWHDKKESKICNNPSNKKFFNLVKKKMHYTSVVPPLVDKDKRLYTTDEEKANLMNTTFQKVFTKDNGIPVNIPTRQCPMMRDFDILATDIHVAIANLKNKVCRTPENIPPFFIKKIINPLISPLLYFFNTSLNFNIIPYQWKQAFIIPIYKKGDKNNGSNYRPISLTSTFSRILESILYTKILDHLLNSNLISHHQFGFLPLKSTTSQLLTCLHSWLISKAQKVPTSIVYTDISKAFDSVVHSKLISVIASYKINPSLIHWISNFLHDRYQQVVLNNILSAPCHISSGVPQGSVLGPLLFLIYMDDITQCAKPLENFGNISLFADDTKLFSTNQTKLQSSLDELAAWLKNRQLNLAVEKCFHLNTDRGPPSISSQVYLNDTCISSKSSIKDLGVYISDDLKWTSHVNFIYKNASLSSFQILNAFKTKNIWTLLQLYKTYVRPKLEYSSPVWSPSSKQGIDKIESVQRRFTRTICRRSNISYSSYSDRLFKLNLQSLEYRRAMLDLVFMYKTIKDLSGLSFTDHFSYRLTKYNLRGNNSKIESPFKFKDSQWCGSFFVRVPKMWNLLPESVISSPSLSVFKERIKKINLNDVATLQYP